MPEKTWEEQHSKEETLRVRLAGLKARDQGLVQKIKALKERAAWYRAHFEESPISLWEVDFSEMRRGIDRLHAAGVGRSARYFEEHPQILADLVAQVRILAVNRITLDFFAAHSKEELTAGLPQIITPDFYRVFIQGLEGLSRKRRFLRGEAVLRTLTGRALSVFFQFTVLPGHVQTLDKASIGLIDITERKRAEEALLQSERTLKEAQQIAHLGDWVWEPGEDRITWSEEMFRIYGFAPGEIGLSYASFFACTHPDDQARLQAAVDTALAGGEPLSIDYRIRKPDGAERTMHARGSVSFDAAGHPVRLIGIVQDVTERKRTEQTLRHFAAIVASTYEAIISATLDGTILSWNPAGERMFGYTADEVIGQQITTRVSFDRMAEINGYLQRIRAGEKIAPFDTVGLAKDGRQFDISMTIAPIHDEQGVLTGMLGLMRDISERKRMETELRTLANTDPLTGASNRRHFLEQAGRELARSERYATPTALLIMDIDYFKRINDTYGHAVGDAVLQALVTTSRATLRGTDLFGRLGGEEFAAVLIAAPADTAALVAERLRAAVAGLEVRNQGQTVRLTVSIGVGLRRPGELAIEELLKRTDAALYQAKDRGRNRVVVEGQDIPMPVRP